MTFRYLMAAASVPLGLASMTAARPACARDAAVRQWHLPAQSLAAALRAISVGSGRSIAAPGSLLAGKQAPALDGNYSVERAVEVVLAGSGLHARRAGDAIVIEGDDAAIAGAANGGDIIVTGTRIAGAKNPSAMVVVQREAMKSAGRTSVDDVIRTIPENFSGGQNPGVGFNVPESSGANIGSGSSVNLRGLGSDATLTLLDGRRLAYSAALQSIDIAAIPFGAIDRIEIVPDGASAIYGSDAVAGVVNVILRRNFSGVETTAKIGAATDGGDFLQQYGAIAGTKWRSGGVFLAYEFDRNSAVTTDQRDYLATIRPGLTLLPSLYRHNVAVSAHQIIAPGLTFSIDGLWGRRHDDNHYPLNAGGDLSVSRSDLFSTGRSFSVAPSLELRLDQGWSLSLAGTYGADRIDYGGDDTFGAAKTPAGSGYYRNRGSSMEFAANGNLFSLPGGIAKLAAGAGFRRNEFLRFTGSATSQIDHSQDSYYAFGELNLPVVERVTASAALRYERYPGIGSVVTPKLGAIIGLSTDFDLKGSWGKSFRAPTLYEQYQPSFAYLIGAASVGGTAAPAGSTALLLLGGNPDLKPERSTNWSTTLDFHPHGIPGLDLSLSYFSVDYRNRAVTPILLLNNALTDPTLAQFVTLAPSSAAQTAFITSAGSFTNAAGVAYDPSKVVAIVRNASVNAGRLRARGADVALAYKSTIGRGSFNTSIDLSYIDSSRQLSADQAYSQLAGILFNPPHLKGRGELGYSLGSVSLTGDVTYIGPVRDTRQAVPLRVAGMTPVDLTLRYRPKGSGLCGGLDIILAVQNLFNERPAVIATSVFYDTPYDSTNYGALGRVLSVSVTKKW